MSLFIRQLYQRRFMDSVGLLPAIIDICTHLMPLQSVDIAQTEKLPLDGSEGINGLFDTHLKCNELVQLLLVKLSERLQILLLALRLLLQLSEPLLDLAFFIFNGLIASQLLLCHVSHLLFLSCIRKYFRAADFFRAVRHRSQMRFSLFS